MNRATYRFNDSSTARSQARSAHLPAGDARFVQTGVTNFPGQPAVPDRHGQRSAAGRIQAMSPRIPARLLLNTRSASATARSGIRRGTPRRTTGIRPDIRQVGPQAGPYLVISLLGASDVRDAFGSWPHLCRSGTYIKNDAVKYGLWVVRLVDIRAAPARRGRRSAGRVRP